MARPSADTTADRKPIVGKKTDKVSAHPDTTLAAACAGLGKGSVAQNLVVVVFGAAVGAEERAAAIKRAAALLLSRPDATDDSYYVRLRDTDGRPAQTLADHLIQLPQIQSVSLAPCPSPSAP